MRFENAFFTREARAFGRGQFRPLARAILLQSAALAAPLLLVEGWLPWTEAVGQRLGGLMLLWGIHAAACAGTGGRLGYRVFGDEIDRGTLDALRLVTVPPWKWLLQKLLFPLYGMALVWGAALPFYAALVLRGHFLPSYLAVGALLAAACGLLALCATLLLGPEGVVALRNHFRHPSRPTPTPGAGHLGPVSYLFGLVAIMAFDWVRADGYLGDALRTTAFYGAWVPKAAVLAALLGGCALAALAAGHATADPANSRATALGRAGRALLSGAAYYQAVGWLWPGLALPYRVAWLLGLPAAALAARWYRRRTGSRREDRLGTREIEWLNGRWDNPAFIRDLRVALRASGLRRQGLSAATSMLLFPPALALATLLPPLAFPLSMLFGSGPPVGAFFFRWGVLVAALSPVITMIALMNAGSQAAVHWRSETRFDTLAQVLATPMASETLVRGRWTASALVSLTMLLPSLISLAVGIAVVAATRPSLLPTYLLVQLYLGSSGLLCATLLGSHGQVRWLQWVCAPLLPLELMVGLGVGLSSLAAQAMGMDASPVLALLPYLPATALVNLLLTVAVYFSATGHLERLRHADLR
jgi:hypothetical protein